MKYFKEIVEKIRESVHALEGLGGEVSEIETGMIADMHITFLPLQLHIEELELRLTTLEEKIKKGDEDNG